jgi:NADH-quinone oxidoreductase subunit N
MVGYMKGDRLSNEASLKYVLFGAISTGTMLFGMSLLYGLAGTLDLYGIRTALADQQMLVQSGPALMVIILMVLAGIGFKMAAVPFHFWCPDVYTGAPTPVTAFLSVGPKVAGFAVLVRFFYGGLAQPSGDASWAMVGAVNWQAILIGVSVLTMTLGNVTALLQTNLKRLLAYSSIAHAGYMLMGLALMTEEGIQAVLFYLIVYAIMNIGAFLVVITLSADRPREEIDDFRGLGWRMPGLAAAMAIFLFSLTGLPPFAGFVGKVYLFRAVIEKEMYWLAIAGALNSVVSLYYYVRIVKTMYLDAPGGDEESVPARPFPAIAVTRSHAAIPFLPAAPSVYFGIRFGLVDAMSLAGRRIFLGH